mmetsp:Transcript_6686/g.5833  ORF Transcript_6686/g.5833 Transcript_6686/m.5833 type:complete len:153 (+) Transcript_6686:32-490(+)
MCLLENCVSIVAKASSSVMFTATACVLRAFLFAGNECPEEHSSHYSFVCAHRQRGEKHYSARPSSESAAHTPSVNHVVAFRLQTAILGGRSCVFGGTHVLDLAVRKRDTILSPHPQHLGLLELPRRLIQIIKRFHPQLVLLAGITFTNRALA